MDASRSDSGSPSSYCPNCGTDVTPSANVCSHCGSGFDGREDDPVDDRDVLEYRISRALEAGWELEHDLGDRAVMSRTHVGDGGTHLLIAVLTLWWTLGAGNLLYGAYCYVSGGDRMVLRADGVDVVRTGSGDDGGPPELPWLEAVPVALVLWVGSLVALVISMGTSWPLAAVPLALGTGLALGGVGVLPPVRRRLEDRKSVTTNGWVRSVDERAIDDHDGRCTGCGGPVDRGVERTYRKEFCLLGVPVRTAEGGTNCYCDRCAIRDADRATDVGTDGPSAQYRETGSNDSSSDLRRENGEDVEAEREPEPN